MYFSLKQPSLFSASMMEWSLDDSKKSIIAIIYKLAFWGQLCSWTLTSANSMEVSNTQD